MLDIGANAECRPEFLLQFAFLGKVYAQSLLGLKDPKIGLLSNGEEEDKGNELIRAAYHLLKDANLNFIGNVEGKELFNGQVDVVVTDGFTGNIVKSTEAVAKLIIDVLREELMGSSGQIGAVSQTCLPNIKSILDPAELEQRH